MVPAGVPSVASNSEQTILIARIIERYVTDHPRAADTPEGIRSWWVARQRYGDSLEDVQKALDYLVEHGRISRTVLPDGAALYGRAVSAGTSSNGKDDASD
jgi:hypothetical protein